MTMGGSTTMKKFNLIAIILGALFISGCSADSFLGSESDHVVEISGDTHNVSGDTHNVSGDTHNVSGDTHNVSGN